MQLQDPCVAPQLYPTVPSAQLPGCTPGVAGPQRMAPKRLSLRLPNKIPKIQLLTSLAVWFKENKDISSRQRGLSITYLTLLLTFPPGNKQFPEFPWVGLNHTLGWGTRRMEMEETKEGKTWYLRCVAVDQLPSPRTRFSAFPYQPHHSVYYFTVCSLLY